MIAGSALRSDVAWDSRKKSSCRVQVKICHTDFSAELAP